MRNSSDFDAEAAEWYDKLPDPTWIESLGSVVRLPACKNALDVGCGGGRYALALREASIPRVIGLDLSWRMLMLASANDEDRRLEFVQTSVEKLPFETSSFDLVLVRYLLHHVASIQAALAHCCRVTRPTGTLVVETSRQSDLESHFDHQIYPKLGEITTQLYPPVPAIRGILKKQGFFSDVVAIERKAGKYRPIDAALQDSFRLVEEGRGPLAWRLLSDDERVEFHLAREAMLPELFPDGKVPRGWRGVILVAKAVAPA